jgi:hypothetical protein
VAAPKDRLTEAALDLAWSHWVGLGVRGTAKPPTTAVDPEALLYLTAFVVESDPRLRDEVADWWQRYAQHLSRPRLNALEARFGAQAASKLEEMLETIARTTRTSGKSVLEHLSTPARTLLRMRCVFGANARAELLLELLLRSTEGLTALTLSDVGYSKRNVALVLEDLVMGAVLVAAKEGNRTRYRLAAPDALARMLAPLPQSSGQWHSRLPIVTTFLELSARLRGKDAVTQGIEARKSLQRVTAWVEAAGITEPPPSTAAETFWPALQEWVIDSVIAERPERGRELPRMVEGHWIPPNEVSRGPERFTSAILPRESANLSKDAEFLCLDLVQVPTVVPPGDWVWMVLSTAATTTYAHTIGLNAGEPWRFETWISGRRRSYAVSYAEPMARDRISRVYGATAVERLRADHPAVQLRLKLIE